MVEIEGLRLLKFHSSVLAQQCEKMRTQVLNYQKYIDPIGRVISNRGGWQSRFIQEDNSFPFYDECWKLLNSALDYSYRDYVEKFYEPRYEELYGNARIDEQPFRIGRWFNINWTGNFNLEHCHLDHDPLPGPPMYADEFSYLPAEMKDNRPFWLPRAFGNFYMADTENTFFASANTPHGHIKEEDRTYLNLKAGDYLIGDPHINHGVAADTHNNPRVTIAYNIYPEAKLKEDSNTVITNFYPALPGRLAAEKERGGGSWEASHILPQQQGTQQ